MQLDLYGLARSPRRQWVHTRRTSRGDGPKLSNRQVRLGSALLSLALALSLGAVALASTEDDSLTPDSTSAAGALAPGQMPAPKLFLQLTAPPDLDVAVPLETGALTVQGMTVPGAVVSVGGDLVDVDAQGNFANAAVVTEGANAIDVVASDDQGNQVSTTLYVVRGE